MKKRPTSFRYQDDLHEKGFKKVTFFPVFSTIAGSTTAGIAFAQLLYWDAVYDEKPFYKSNSMICQETALTRHEFSKAKTDLLREGLIEIEVEGMPAVTWYTVRKDRYEARLAKLVPVSQTCVKGGARKRSTSRPESGQLVGRKAAHKDKGETSVSPKERSISSPRAPRRGGKGVLSVRERGKLLRLHSRWLRMATSLRDAVAAGKTIPKNYNLRSSALALRALHKRGSGDTGGPVEVAELEAVVSAYCEKLRAVGDCSYVSRPENGYWPECRHGSALRAKWDRVRAAVLRQKKDRGEEAPEALAPRKKAKFREDVVEVPACRLPGLGFDLPLVDGETEKSLTKLFRRDLDAFKAYIHDRAKVPDSALPKGLRREVARKR